MATERLKFRLELYATMWDKPPHVQIGVNDKFYHNGDIKGHEEIPDIIEFEHDFSAGQDCKLLIIRSGKDKHQTVLDPENSKIVKDQILHLKKIEIDDIDIGTLIYEGVFHPAYQEPWYTQQKEKGVDLPTSFTNVTELGHNGAWEFKFSSPFYMWLLENLY